MAERGVGGVGCKTATAAGHVHHAGLDRPLRRRAALNPPQPFPEAALFRAMAAHDPARARRLQVVYADSESASSDDGDLKKFSGLELLAALPASLAHTVVRSSSTAAASLDSVAPAACAR